MWLSLRNVYTNTYKYLLADHYVHGFNFIFVSNFRHFANSLSDCKILETVWALHLERTTEHQLANSKVLLCIITVPCVGFQWHTIKVPCIRWIQYCYYYLSINHEHSQKMLITYFLLNVYRIENKYISYSDRKFIFREW